MKHKYEILMALSILIVLVIIAIQYNSCDGEFVRGLLWYECIGDL